MEARGKLLLGLLFDPEYGSSLFLRKASRSLVDYTTPHPRRQHSLVDYFVLPMVSTATESAKK
jgi:hypothetical protein